MNAREAIKHMMEQSHTSGSALSYAIGKDRNAVATIFNRGTTPRVDTLAKMCEAMGYKIVLRSDTDEVEIDPSGDGQ